MGGPASCRRPRTMRAPRIDSGDVESPVTTPPFLAADAHVPTYLIVIGQSPNVPGVHGPDEPEVT